MIAGALVGGSVLLANPLPSTVFGQQPPGVTGDSATQPSVNVLGGRPLTPSVSTIPTTAGPTTAGPTTAGSTTSGATAAGVTAAGAPMAGTQVVAQQPTALPRTGTGIAADTPLGNAGAFVLLTVALALLGGGAALRRARARS
jgi:hypothetical protein